MGRKFWSGLEGEDVLGLLSGGNLSFAITSQQTDSQYMRVNRNDSGFNVGKFYDEQTPTDKRVGLAFEELLFPARSTKRNGLTLCQSQETSPEGSCDLNYSTKPLSSVYVFFTRRIMLSVIPWSLVNFPPTTPDSTRQFTFCVLFRLSETYFFF